MKLSGIFGLRPSAKYISASVAALGALAITAQANAADIYAPVPGGYKDIPDYRSHAGLDGLLCRYQYGRGVVRA